MNDDSGMVGLALDAQAVAVGEGVLHPAVNIAQADAHALGLDLPALQLGQHILVHAGAVVLHVQVHGAVLRPAPNAYDAGFQHFLRGVVHGVFHQGLDGHGGDAAAQQAFLQVIFHPQPVPVAQKLDAQVFLGDLQVLLHADHVPLVVQGGAEHLPQGVRHGGDALVLGVFRQAVDGLQGIVQEMRAHLGPELLHLLFLQKALLLVVIPGHAVIVPGHFVKVPVQLADLIPAGEVRAVVLGNRLAGQGEGIELLHQDFQVPHH